MNKCVEIPLQKGQLFNVEGLTLVNISGTDLPSGSLMDEVTLAVRVNT